MNITAKETHFVFYFMPNKEKQFSTVFIEAQEKDNLHALISLSFFGILQIGTSTAIIYNNLGDNTDTTRFRM
jgi:hypothetical protein